MAITVGSTTFQATAPTKAGQIIVASNSDAQNIAYRGFCDLTSDGSATTATINWIDGTESLPFTPSGVLLSVQNKTAADATAMSATAYDVDNKICKIKLSAAGTNTNVYRINFVVLK